MTKNQTATIQLSWINRLNLAYGVVGILVFASLSTSEGWKSFLAGWAVSIVNLELIKRLTYVMISVFKGEKLNPIFYGMLVGKFAFWGGVIAVLSMTAWIQGVPFLVGLITIVFAGLGLGIKELVYARTPSSV
ncbi:MAG: hypothetical protein AB1540_15450 [Bdellovibrionota bacterium]